MDLLTAESLLSTSGNHRVLRRVPDLAGFAQASANPDFRTGVIVDTETTGTGDADEVIELAMQRFTYDRDTGKVLSVGASFCELQQPSIPIPAESTRVHGITDADVAGKSIDPKQVTQFLTGANIVIAHSAGFDRPKCEKHWPVFESQHWACSLDDIDWRGAGFGGRALDYLLFRQGWFYDGHRALADAQALLWLLTLPLPDTDRTALAALLETARKPLWMVRAQETPFDMKDLLSARGYRWQPATTTRVKAWVAMTGDPEAEVKWLRETIYAVSHPTMALHRLPVFVEKVTATDRFSGRVG